MSLEGLVEAHVEIEGEPKPKERPRKTGNWVYTPRKTKEREKKIAEAFKDRYDGMFGKGIPLRLEMDFYFSIPKSGTKKERAERAENRKRPMGKGDIDNLQKTVADALNKVAYYDDSQIAEMVGRKYWGEVGKTVVRIMRLDV